MRMRSAMFRLQRLTAGAAWLGAVAVGCAGDEGPAQRRSGTSSPAAGAANAPGTEPGAAASDGLIVPSSGSNTGTAAPTGTAAAAGAAQSMQDSMLDRETCGATHTAGLTPEQIQALMTSAEPGEMRWLYPYAGTVFPRGMLSPTLMWDGADGKAVYIRVHSQSFDYQGCLATTGPQQLQLPQELWRAAGNRSGGAADPFTIELTVQGPNGPIGPIHEQIVIAQATIKGSIYYNSYSGLGAIYRIPPGGMAQPFIAGTGCYGCHTVSANGQRLLTSTGGGPGASFALTPTTQADPPALTTAPGAAFSGVSPDGTVYFETAHPAGQVRPQGTPADMAVVNDAALYETDTGAAISGSDIPPGAMMPIFSPSGSLIAFNDFAENGGKALAVMDFDPVSRKAANRRVVYADPSDTYPGWPFFLPDDRAIVFSRGVNPQFSGAGAGVFPGLPGAGPQSDLYIVDLASGTTTVLAKAMGLATPDDPVGYLPFGAEDLHQHYYPTVSPVAAGGYFWVFFDSIRHYGNMGLARQLWGTAVRISPDGTYNDDPSFPAFYVTGQDFLTGNHRAFTALDPCKQDGDSCTSGIDCCGGFCYFEAPEELVEPVGTCSPHMTEMNCSRADERCSIASDCCSDDPNAPALMCIAGFCAIVAGPD